MTALSDAKTYLAKQAASGVQATMHADHIEVILARLVAEIEAAPEGLVDDYRQYPDGSGYVQVCDIPETSNYLGKRVRLLALDSGGAGEVSE